LQCCTSVFFQAQHRHEPAEKEKQKAFVHKFFNRETEDFGFAWDIDHQQELIIDSALNFVIAIYHQFIMYFGLCRALFSLLFFHLF